MRRRKNQDERELETLGARIEAAREELAGAEAEVEQALVEQREVLELETDSYLGLLDPAEFEVRRAKAETRLAAATEARDRQRRIAHELERRYGRLAQDIATAAVAKARAEATSADQEVERLRTQLAEAEQARDSAHERLAVVEAEALWAGAAYSTEAAERRDAEVERYRGAVVWAAQNNRPDDVPVWLRGEYEAERDRLEREAEEQRERLSAEAEASWRDVGAEPPRAAEDWIHRLTVR